MTGYLGSQVCLDFLKDESFIVRGTVRDKRDQAKILPLKKALGTYFDKLKLCYADLEDPDSIDYAIKGATFVVHTASPIRLLSQQVDEIDLISPSVDSIKSVLESCKKHKVKRLVITSSISAINAGWTEKDKPSKWNESHWS